jgi:hypothetical protein
MLHCKRDSLAWKQLNLALERSEIEAFQQLKIGSKIWVAIHFET